MIERRELAEGRAIDWVRRVFGFEEIAHWGERVHLVTGRQREFHGERIAPSAGLTGRLRQYHLLGIFEARLDAAAIFGGSGGARPRISSVATCDVMLEVDRADEMIVCVGHVELAGGVAKARWFVEAARQRLAISFVGVEHLDLVVVGIGDIDDAVVECDAERMLNRTFCPEPSTSPKVNNRE